MDFDCNIPIIRFSVQRSIPGCTIAGHGSGQTGVDHCTGVRRQRNRRGMAPMPRVMTKQRLERENLAYRFTGGVSQENRCSGFAPAFRDNETGVIYQSLRACGDPAPFHCLDGLPEAVVMERDTCGVRLVKPTIEAGFVRGGVFYTRAEAAEFINHGG